MPTPRIISLIILLSIAPTVLARTGSANVSSACATLEFVAKMVTLNTMIPANYDDIDELLYMEDSLAELNRRVCQPVILTEYTRGSNYYSDGSLISTDLYYDAWYYPNDRLFMAAPGEDTPIYYPNGRVMAHHWMHGEQLIFWPNGNLATDYFQAFDVSWYYPDGNVIAVAESSDYNWVRFSAITLSRICVRLVLGSKPTASRMRSRQGTRRIISSNPLP